jgi:hypothetical protein
MVYFDQLRIVLLEYGRFHLEHAAYTFIAYLTGNTHFSHSKDHLVNAVREIIIVVSHMECINMQCGQNTVFFNVNSVSTYSNQ